MARTLPATQPWKHVPSLFRESFDFSLLEAEESWISLNFILTYTFLTVKVILHMSSSQLYTSEFLEGSSSSYCSLIVGT